MNKTQEMKLKCLIVEDEQPAQWVLKHFIDQSEHLVLVAIANDAKEAKDVLENQTIDLLFLDINLPGISGIEFLDSLEQQPPVIFTTVLSTWTITLLSSAPFIENVPPFYLTI